jgi:hypothetical protein
VKQFAPRVGASEIMLEDGQVLVAGEQYELSDEQLKEPHNKRLIESGQILEVKSQKKAKESGS